jgi:metal-responsive CopG/Arc/MetJ family transcriptional regulator
MERTTISIPDELLQRLRVMAAERRTSIAALVREALEEKARSYRPRPRSLGIGASGHTDTSRRTSEERAEPRPWR